jgi:hypothetical protein
MRKMKRSGVIPAVILMIVLVSGLALAEAKIVKVKGSSTVLP